MNTALNNRIWIAGVLMSVVSCKKVQSTSQVKYAETGTSGLTAYANQSVIPVCTNAPANGDQIKRAVGMWFLTLDKKPEITIVNLGADCNATVIYESRGNKASFTNLGSHPEVHMNAQDSWFASFPVLVHEFGHGFGLGDTYNTASGESGDCVAGQPREAVMCTPNYAQPQQDDINGVRAIAGMAGGGSPDFNSIPGSSGGGSDSVAEDSTNGGGAFDPSSLSDIASVEDLEAQLQKLFGGKVSLSAPKSGAASKKVASAPSQFTEESCGSSVKAILNTKQTYPSKSEQSIAVATTFKAVNLSICLGGYKSCASPHAARLGTQIIKQGTAELHVSGPLTSENKKTLSTVTVDGVIQENRKMRSFRCESVITKH